MADVSPVARPPKQERSRASFERALDAATELLAERGDDSFTLQEVSQRSGVSIGSIYGRVAGKAELMWAVSERYHEKSAPMHERRLAAMRKQGGDLADLLPVIIDQWAETLKAQAPVLRGLMSVAPRDTTVAAQGGASFRRMKSGILELVLAHRDQIRRPDPEAAVDSWHTITYSALARFLGFGTTPDASGQGDWKVLKRELIAMGLAYLCFDASQTAEG